MDTYSESIMKRLRQWRELEEDDYSKDKEIMNHTPHELFDMLLEWEGIIGYRYMIIGWIEELYKIRLR